MFRFRFRYFCFSHTMAALVRGFQNSVIICNRALKKTVPRAATIVLQKKALCHNAFIKGTPSFLLNQKRLPRTSKQIRQFAEGNVSIDQIQERVIKVLSQFGKISGDKLKLDSHFMNDLGLDSLDHVEIIMAMEDEFGFEIPDVDAEKLLKPADIVRYVADREDVYA